MLSNTSYDLILRSLGLTTTFLNGTCNQMASKPGDGSGSEVRRGVMRTVMRPSRQSPQQKTHSVSLPELQPTDLQRLSHKEEQRGMAYEDNWKGRCGPLLHDVSCRVSDVSCRRSSDKLNQQCPNPGINEPSQSLPPELQKLVDKEEADRLLYEDSWMRTSVHFCSHLGLFISLIMSCRRPADKFLEEVSMVARTKPGGSPRS